MASIISTRRTAHRSPPNTFWLGRKAVPEFGWPKKEEKIIGSIFIVERPADRAQLRLLFVDQGIRGQGLGRWLVEESIRYCREAGFSIVYLWTVRGLDRAISIYESFGFKPVEEKKVEDWGRTNLEVRFDLTLE